MSSIFAAPLGYTPRTSAGTAELVVDLSERGSHQVSRRLLGKFCEHLGANINQGMEAQILHNPVMGRWRFSAGDDHPDGGVREESNRERIAARIATDAARHAWPDAEALRESFFDGGPYGWFRMGSREQVTLGAEPGPHGGRAQRVEIVSGAGTCGIGQWIHLPLHRVRQYQWRMVARAVPEVVVLVRLGSTGDAAAGVAQAADSGAVQAQAELTCDWQTYTGTFTIPEDPPEDAPLRFSVTTEGPAHLEIDRILLYPADHVNGADPDVIDMLRAARLPLLRWPGGNFVSGYHWRDGVGPVDARPTRPNPAWEGLEFNLFGTDEFIAFCRAVSCEPLICVNAGNGTAAEAAAWVEYCNGPTDTPMGRLRTANGHPEPYGVRYWEIGNEVYGRWQVGWTTATGNVDRYRRFRAAMLAVDPDIQLIGCGYGNEPLSAWNQELIDAAGSELRCISDHILTGGLVGATTDPVELFHAFMGYTTVLQERYRVLCKRMVAGGIHSPRLAITELQLFAHFHGEAGGDEGLSREKMPAPDTVAEALSVATIVHACIRLGDFVELLTHSATVNHGGGLRKLRERVYANPVHHAHVLAAALTGGSPVALRLACGAFSTGEHFGHIPPLTQVPYLDPMAVCTPAGDLVLMLVHRGADCGPIELSIQIEGFEGSRAGKLAQLRGEHWWDKNTREAPERIVPRYDQVNMEADGRVDLVLPSLSLTRLIFPHA